MAHGEGDQLRSRVVALAFQLRSQNSLAEYLLRQLLSNHSALNDKKLHLDEMKPT